MGNVSIIVPCFNEEQTVPIFYKSVTPILTELGIGYEILFVDDGSRDLTQETVLKIAKLDPRVSLISFSRNFGKEAALLAGLEHALGDAVVVMDVDLQDPPELLPQLVKGWQDGYDVVFTRRVNRQGEPPVRSWFARRFYDIINKLSDVKIVDGARDYRIMSRRVVDSILNLRERARFCKGLFSWVGFSSHCIEYENVARVAGNSSWSFWKLFNYAIEGIVSFSTAPLRLATYFGIVIGILSLGFMLVKIIDTLLYGNPVSGYPSLVSIILFSTGIQLIFLGIIGEYLSRMFKELKARPHYLIKNYTESSLRIHKPAKSRNQHIRTS
ncbi:MAG: glycosyltransferase family 2 protein [Negativicutes bacterium]|nr:glycosyltransferase family 2 protein [Negativicutes bacterium]